MFLSHDNLRVLHKSQMHWPSVTWMGNRSHCASWLCPIPTSSVSCWLPCISAGSESLLGSCLGSVNFIGYWLQKFLSIPKIERGKDIIQATDKPLFQVHGLSNYIKSCFLWREVPWWWFFSVSLVYKWNGVTAPIKVEHCALSRLLTGGKNPLSACELCLKCRNLNPGI